MAVKIKEIISREEFLNAFDLIKELRTNLEKKSYLSLLEPMIQNGFRLFAMSCDDEIVALAGLSISTNFYYGKHIWIYDLIVKEGNRSKGYGKRIMDYVEDLALKNGCKIVALSSGRDRIDAHSFYENKVNFIKTSYVFKKDISDLLT